MGAAVVAAAAAVGVRRGWAAAIAIAAIYMLVSS